MNLSQAAFDKARKFIEDDARPLEAARLRYHFDGAPAAGVFAELTKYQNPDGGFGHALEPDLRTPLSSALAASLAFQILRDTGPGGGSAPFVPQAVAYLLSAFDPQRSVWRIIPPAAGDSPHAPWWDQSGLEQSFNSFTLNPTAELLGYLLDYSKDVPSQMLDSLTETVLARIQPLEAIEMHDFLCCKRLLETVNLSYPFRSALLANLTRLLDGVVARQPSQWQGYGLRPVQVADRPDSPFYLSLRDVIDQNLDFEIASQGAGGSWAPLWSWGDTYPDAWDQAGLDWAGVLTLEKLLLLQRYGRIEGMR